MSEGLLSRDKRNFLALCFLLPVPIISPRPPGARAAPLNPTQLRGEVDHGGAGEDARLGCGSGICCPPPRAPPPARLGLSCSGLTHAAAC